MFANIYENQLIIDGKINEQLVLPVSSGTGYHLFIFCLPLCLCRAVTMVKDWGNLMSYW